MLTLSMLLKLVGSSEPLVMAVLSIIRSRHQTPPIVNEDGTPFTTWDEVHAKVAKVVSDLAAIKDAAEAELAAGGD